MRAARVLSIVLGMLLVAPGAAALYFMAQQGSDPTTRDIRVSYTTVPVPVPPTLPLPTVTKEADGAPGSAR